MTESSKLRTLPSAILSSIRVVPFLVTLKHECCFLIWLLKLFSFLLGLADLSSSPDDLHFSHVCFVKDEVSICRLFRNWVCNLVSLKDWVNTILILLTEFCFLPSVNIFLLPPCVQVYLMWSKIPLCRLSLDSEFTKSPDSRSATHFCEPLLLDMFTAAFVSDVERFSF